MRRAIVVLAMLLAPLGAASAQVSIGIGLPNVSIGINLPVYPQLVPVPGYPVYYAPQVNSNYFFYDGMYWVYQQDNWYASSWYNGPWSVVAPDYVPLYVLRVPVRYYRAPPVYFRGWSSSAPPRWGDHWGNQWQQSHSGWDRWNRNAVPAPAPLPVYQRQYSGNRYPRAEQQTTLQSQHYRYQPRDTTVRQAYQAQGIQPAPNQPPQRGTQPTTRASQPTQEYNRGNQPPANNYAPNSPPQQRAQPMPGQPQAGGAPPQQRQQPMQAPPQAAGAPPQQRQQQMQAPPPVGAGGPPPQRQQQSVQPPPPGGQALAPRQSSMQAPPPQQQQRPPQGNPDNRGRGQGPDKGDEKGK